MLYVDIYIFTKKEIKMNGTNINNNNDMFSFEHI